MTSLGIGTGITKGRGRGRPPIITATTAPSLGALTDGDTVQSSYTAGSYASTAGTIDSAVETVTINGTTGALADVVSFDDAVSVSILVTDSADNTQTFNAGTQTVQGIAPTAVTAPVISGAQVGSTPSITPGTYDGTPTPTVLGAFTLDGAAFDPPTELQEADEGKTLAYVEEATNGIDPDAQQTVTVTVVANNLLDRYPGAAFAYSLRQLSSSTTHVARVQRSSDNAEDDFTASEITDGTLTAWVGTGNDGFVVTRYDQSGNGRHATQSTVASQMKLVDSGTLVTENGKPILLHDGVDDGFSFTPPALIDDVLVVCVQTVTDASASRILSMSATDNDDFKPDGLIINRALFGFGDVSGQTSDENRLDTPEPPLNQLYIRSNQKNSTAFNVRENGSEIASKSPITMTLSPDRAAIGYAVQDVPGTSPWIGTMGDLIVYTSDESANLTAIEQDVADYYGITLA